MTDKDPLHILLVHPPLESPSAPPWNLARVAGQLSGPGIALGLYDANLEFYLNYLLNPVCLANLLNIIDRRENRGNFKGSEFTQTSLLKDLTSHRKHWERKIEEIRVNVNQFKSDDFYRPERYLAILSSIRDLLNLHALAFSPLKIQQGHFTNPLVTDGSQSENFIEDEKNNPFIQFCQQSMVQKIAEQKVELLILLMNSPSQVLPAATMGRFSKSVRPEIHVALSGSPSLLKGATRHVDSVLPENDLQALSDLLGGLGGNGFTADDVGSDFDGLPIGDYLAPGAVLFFQRLPGLGDKPSWTSSFIDRIKDYSQTAGFEGFLIDDKRLKLSHIKELTRELSQQKINVGLSLKCSLDGSVKKEQIAIAHDAGLRVIRWRDPIGPISTLTTTLWEVSRAGIWNHMVLSGDSEDDLTGELIKFAMANPNIVHSWEYRESVAMPSGILAQTDPEVKGSYGQVTKLPGISFWNMLDDPAYLLLYLRRYGLKKVLRWRVREDRRSFYSLGANMAYHFVRPQELPPGYLDEICRMVEAGGSVGTKWVRYNLEHAYLIGYVLDEGVIVANSSLKHPREEYVEKVSKKTGLDLSNYLERGYTSVRPEYRGMGIATKLLEGLTTRAGERKIFSIIGEDNLATQKIAIRNRTQQVASFYSEALGKEVGVWIPEWMLENQSTSSRP